jgi:hypothetical protein
VQGRFGSPGAIREFLEVFAEHFNGQWVLVLVPFLDGMSEGPVDQLFAPFVPQNMGRIEQAAQLAGGHELD